MTGILSNSRRLLIIIFIISIALEIVLLVYFVSINNSIGLSVVGSILSGTIVGVFVTFSQARISASIYEESRVKTQHLDDIKKFLKGKDAATLAKIMINKDQHSKEFIDLEDIGKHWPEFSRSLSSLSQVENESQKKDDELKKIKTELGNNIREIIREVNQEIEKKASKIRFLA